MKKILAILLTGLILLSCSDTSDGKNNSDPIGSSSSDPSSGSESGTVTVNLSGVPFSTENLTKINIRIAEIWASIGEADEEWINLVSFHPGLDVNLLDYLGENTLILAEEIQVPTDRVNQLRLILDAPEEGEETAPVSSHCYLFYDDGEGNTSTEPLVIPSDSSSGIKGVGEFTVPRNGSVDIALSFDARRFVTLGDGSIKMKPVIWVVAEDEAGAITGVVKPVDKISSYPDLSVYAYEQGEYDAGQLDPDGDGLQFPGAVYSCFVDPGDGSFTLPYLAAGDYDLILAYREAGLFAELQAEYGVELESGETIDVTIELPLP